MTFAIVTIVGGVVVLVTAIIVGSTSLWVCVGVLFLLAAFYLFRLARERRRLS